MPAQEGAPASRIVSLRDGRNFPWPRRLLPVQAMRHSGRIRRSERRVSFLLSFLAVLLSLASVTPARLLYRCTVTGEVLSACCRDLADAGSSASSKPTCCTMADGCDGAEDDVELDESDCDCCDAFFDDVTGSEPVAPNRDAAESSPTGTPATERVATIAVIPARSVVPPSTKAPPRPLHLLFAVYRC